MIKEIFWNLVGWFLKRKDAGDIEMTGDKAINVNARTINNSHIGDKYYSQPQKKTV